jgi:hypothetical protein
MIVKVSTPKTVIKLGKRTLDGNASGPASSTDNAIVRFDGATGKLLQSSLATLDDAGNIATPGTVDGRDVSVDGANLDIARTDHAGTDAPNNITVPSSRTVRAGDAVAGGTADQAGGNIDLKPGRSKGIGRALAKLWAALPGAAGTTLNNVVEMLRLGGAPGDEVPSLGTAVSASCAGDWRFVDRVVVLGQFLAAPGSTIQLNGSFIFGLRQLTMTDPITPPAIGAGNTNNYAPSGFFDCAWILQNVSAAGAVMTGLRFTDDGQMIYLQNISDTVANVLTLAHESASSDAANRFLLPGNASLVIPNNGGALLRYDGTAARWRVLSH